MTPDGHLGDQVANHIGGSARVLSGRACHSALRCQAGIEPGCGHRPGTGWTSLREPIGGWSGFRCRAQPAAGPPGAGTLVVAMAGRPADRPARKAPF